MIRFDAVGVTYDGAHESVLRDVNLEIREGELALVVGRTGTGKSTLLGTINGLVPHFSGGTLHGRVTIDGRDTRTHPPRELADLVGVVGQDPLRGFVTDTVEDELAYAMECLGLAPAVMRRRVEETLDLLGLADLRERALRTLSGGQRQRVAIGSVLTAHPKVLVLDEPTSALDPAAAEEVLAALQRLVHDLGVTVVMAEHRLERVVQYADRLLILPGDGSVVEGTPAELMGDSPVAPPVVELARLAGWSPLPLSVRDARRQAAPLRERLTRAEPAAIDTAVPAVTPVAQLDSVSVRYGGGHGRFALRGVSLRVGAGEVVAVMGRNGAGKTTLLGTLVGLRRTDAGAVRLLASGVGLPEVDPVTLPGPELVKRVGLVPQDPGDLLWSESVEAECRAGDADAGAPNGTTAAVLARLNPGLNMQAHPRDLSEGQRLSLALAVILAARPPLLLLDEPTRGLDYEAKTRLVEVLHTLCALGHTVVMATHDVELVAEVASRVVVLADGEIVADGPTAEVVVSSPMFAPQVSKVLAPLPFLTVAAVVAALARPERRA